jgi:hypothetical protein
VESSLLSLQEIYKRISSIIFQPVSHPLPLF